MTGVTFLGSMRSRMTVRSSLVIFVIKMTNFWLTNRDSTGAVSAARARKDDLAIFKIEWEQSWLCEDSDSWGVRILPTAGEDVAQLSLFESLG